jgi:hypothetical protein
MPRFALKYAYIHQCDPYFGSQSVKDCRNNYNYKKSKKKKGQHKAKLTDLLWQFYVRPRDLPSVLLRQECLVQNPRKKDIVTKYLLTGKDLRTKSKLSLSKWGKNSTRS